jgi:uncharacterized phage protein (TIGR01671 family)
MREFKFRAWDKELKFMTAQLQYFVEFDGSIWFNLGDNEDDLIEQSDKLILMQYTGLKDKNGIEIFEGDLCKAKIYGLIEYDMICLIVFKNGCFGIEPIEDYVLIESKGKFKSFDQCNTEKNVEVIGNIYQNPELLNC